MYMYYYEKRDRRHKCSPILSTVTMINPRHTYKVHSEFTLSSPSKLKPHDATENDK